MKATLLHMVDDALRDDEHGNDSEKDEPALSTELEMHTLALQTRAEDKEDALCEALEEGDEP